MGGRRRDGADALHDALFRAYFVDCVNIGKREALLEVAERIGMARDRADEVLTDRVYKDAVDADWQRCNELGVSAVPTYLSEGLGIVGAEPYQQLEKLVTKAGAGKRDSAI